MTALKGPCLAMTLYQKEPYFYLSLHLWHRRHNCSETQVEQCLPVSAAQVTGELEAPRPGGPCKYLIFASDLSRRASQERIGLKCERELPS